VKDGHKENKELGQLVGKLAERERDRGRKSGRDSVIRTLKEKRSDAAIRK
jgi:hypothetical protein